MIPVLTTDRLTLRGPRLGDFPAIAAFWASPRSIPEGGPLAEAAAWRDFCASFAPWLVLGYGAWSVEHRADGAFCGIVGLFHPVEYPEPDLGWTVTAEAEGRGIAHEAAVAARAWVWGNTGFESVVSYIDPANARSIRLAERLGGVRDPGAAVVDPGDVVIRHHRGEGRA